MSKLLTVKEVQERLKISESTLFRMMKRNELKGFRIGGGRQWRFEESDVEDYIKRQQAKPEPEESVA